MATGWILLSSFLFMHQTSGAVDNAAYMKTATMSSRLDNNAFGPEKAVDGNTNATYPKGIIDTGPGNQSSWWRVDLGREVQDAAVEIYFRRKYKWRRNGVQLYTSTSLFSDIDRGQLCHTVNGLPNGTDIPDVVSVNCSGSWRYLMVYTQTNNGEQGVTLDFGEVKVLVCSLGTYGINCNKSCSSRHCATPRVSCDRYSGSCTGGCAPAYTGSDCTQVLPQCTSGAYGLNCTKSCNSRQCAVTPTSCDRLTGACPSGGCKAGWMGTDCTQNCTDGFYGENCTKSCESRKCTEISTSCDKVSGQCPRGCQPGWRETDCSQVCVSGMYGPNCSLSCGDRKCTTSTSPCNHVTGQCNGKCLPGWMGTDCTQKCPNGSYGLNCSLTCRNRSCKIFSDTCDHETGNCSGLCKAGFTGTDCVKACTDGTYGVNCVYNCSARHCRTQSSSCDLETGQCPNGCLDGWTGSDCSKSCPDGTFGLSCLNCSVRHCQNRSDCSGDGSCSGGCQDGWTLKNCTQVCPNRTYGHECSNTCGMCANNEVCDHETGNCPNGCKAGWQQSTCIEECPEGKYGVNCILPCGQCNGTCNTQDGQCPGGCLREYKGTKCTMKLETIDPKMPVVPAIAGGVAALLVIIVVVIIIIVYRRRKSLHSDKKLASRQSQIRDNGYGDNVYVNVAMVPEETKDNEITKERKNTANKHAQPQVMADLELEEEIFDEDEPSPNRDYYNKSADVIREVPVADLVAAILKIRRREGGFEVEYNRLPTGFTAPYGDSQKPENAGKNKYRGYYPYDDNRVRLSILADIPGSDYINASHIHSYDQKKNYIAAQAPNKKTVGDFWRMIWEQRCGRVLMLTGLVEDMKAKCYQYWPVEGTLETNLHRIEVELTDTRVNYTVRHIKLTSIKSGEIRTTVQYHFTAWPDHGVPDTLALVNFIWMIRRTDRETDGPLLVHCSAGIGRTGTYIAIDSLLDQAQNEGMVDVQGYVFAMRAERKNMIQTKEQYECVFHCLVEMTTFGDTSMDVGNFTTSYSSRGMDSMVDRKTIRELTRMATLEDGYDSSSRHRMWVDGNQDFIVNVGPSLRQLRGYMLAVSPPPGLEKLLWKLVEENNVHHVVVVSPLQVDPLGDKVTTKKYGDIHLTTTDRTNPAPDFNIMTLKLKKSGRSQVVKLFKFSGSPTMDSMSSHLLDHAHLQHLSAETTPIVLIHNESDRKCAVSFCIMGNIQSGIIEDHRVDVIGHVRTFLKNCPDLRFNEEDVEMFNEFAQKCVQITGTANAYANL